MRPSIQATRESHAPTPHSDRQRTRLVYTLLGALLAIAAMQGRNEWWWPINAWPVYANLSSGQWAPVAVAYELDVMTGDGASITLRARDLVDYGRHELSAHTVALAVHRDASAVRAQARSHLLQLLRLRFDLMNVHAVVVRQRIWPVDPRQVPPVQRHAPLHDLHVAHFDAAGADLPPVTARHTHPQPHAVQLNAAHHAR